MFCISFSVFYILWANENLSSLFFLIPALSSSANNTWGKPPLQNRVMVSETFAFGKPRDSDIISSLKKV